MHDLVLRSKINPRILLDILYATPRNFTVLVSLFFLWSCSPSSMEDLRCEGEAEVRRFSKELKAIHTKEDLAASVPRLKKRYNKMADLLLEVKKFEDKGSGEEESSWLASEELFVELARLYEIPGGKELIEGAQNEAVRKLDRSRAF